MALRQEVLHLYRRVIRVSKTWQSQLGNPGANEEERKYILEEARLLFRKNKEETDEKEIKQFIKEAETRIELANHYQNPYPRPVHLPQHVLHSLASKRMKGQKRKLEQAKPVYMKSKMDDT